MTPLCNRFERGLAAPGTVAIAPSRVGAGKVNRPERDAAVEKGWIDSGPIQPCVQQPKNEPI